MPAGDLLFSGTGPPNTLPLWMFTANTGCSPTCHTQLQATETRNFNPKSCSVCKISKPLTAYWKRAASKDGLQPACKDCQKSSIAQLRESRKDWPQYTGLLQCANCNKLRPAMEFNQRIGTLHGTQYECRACNSIRRRNVYLFRKLLGQDEHASGYNEGQTKVCRCCQSVQPRDQFYPNAGMSDGLQSYCIPCMKAKYIQRRLKSRS